LIGLAAGGLLGQKETAAEPFGDRGCVQHFQAFSPNWRPFFGDLTPSSPIAT
jgi:hypothetical protein